MSLNNDCPCPNCGALDHRLCARCGKCHEWAVFNPLPENIMGEVVSECCGVEDVFPDEYEVIPDESWLDDA